MARPTSIVQIPNLPVAIALNGQEQIECVQAGVSTRITTQQIANLANVSVAENVTTAQKNLLSAETGQLVFDTDLGKLCVYNGSVWQTITSV